MENDLIPLLHRTPNASHLGDPDAARPLRRAASAPPGNALGHSRPRPTLGAATAPAGGALGALRLPALRVQQRPRSTAAPRELLAGAAAAVLGAGRSVAHALHRAHANPRLRVMMDVAACAGLLAIVIAAAVCGGWVGTAALAILPPLAIGVWVAHRFPAKVKLIATPLAPTTPQAAPAAAQGGAAA